LLYDHTKTSIQFSSFMKFGNLGHFIVFPCPKPRLLMLNYENQGQIM